MEVWGFHLFNLQPGRPHLSQVMKARAAASVRRAAPGPTATSLFASDVCLGELALEWPDADIVNHCHLHKVRLNAARAAHLAGILAVNVSPLLVGNMNRKKNQ